MNKLHSLYGVHEYQGWELDSWQLAIKVGMNDKMDYKQLRIIGNELQKV